MAAVSINDILIIICGYCIYLTQHYQSLTNEKFYRENAEKLTLSEEFRQHMNVNPKQTFRMSRIRNSQGGLYIQEIISAYSFIKYHQSICQHPWDKSCNEVGTSGLLMSRRTH